MMNRTNKELKQQRKELRRGSDQFLYNLKNILSSIEDYQEGKISNLRPVLIAIRRQYPYNSSKISIGRRHEDISLGSAIISHIERILLNMGKIKIG